MTSFYATSFIGIGRITAREVRILFADEIRSIQSRKVRDYEITQFKTGLPVQELVKLGTVEDLFCELHRTSFTGARTDLREFQEALTDAVVEPALRLHRALRPGRRGKRPTYCVIVQADASAARLHRRTDVQSVLETALKDRYPRWQPVSDGAELEFWIHLADRLALLGLRLTDRRMRHRTYKSANLPGSLRPTLARAVVQLSVPEDHDVFLDPMCGAGTILIERALAGRYGMLVGGDIDPEAVGATLENFGPRHQPREVHNWDARDLPLPDSHANKVAVNLPWGRQIGSESEIRSLYRRAVGEIERVLADDGTAVFLTGQWNDLKRCLDGCRKLILTEHIQDVRVLGRRADIFVLRKWG